MNPDISFAEKTTTETLVLGVAPQKVYVSERSRPVKGISW